MKKLLLYTFLLTLTIWSYAQYPQIDKQIIFQEQFTSEGDCRLNGGVPTDVDFAYGEGTFNGSSSYVEYSNFKFPDTYSVIFKIKTSSVAANRALLSANKYEFYISSAKSTYYNGATAVSSTSTLSANTYYEIAFVYDGTNMGLYIDGVLDISSAIAKHSTNIGSMFIGRYYSGAEWWNSSIDEIRIYNGDLSAEQVSLLYNQRYYQPFPDMVQDDTLQLLSKVTSVDGVISDVMNDAQGENNPRTWVVNSGTPTISGDAISFIDENSSVKHLAYWTSGSTYKISATISNYSGSGNISLPYDGTTPYTYQSANGTYVYEYTPATTNLYMFSFAGHTATVTVNYIQELRSPITNTNVELVKQGNSEVMSFNSTDSKLDLGVLDNTGNITTYGWFFAKGLGEGNAGHIYSDYNYYSLYIASNKLQLTRDGAGHTAESASVINLNKWVFYCITSTNEGVTNLYIGGLGKDEQPTLSGSADQNGGTPIISTASTTIGNRSISDRTFDGYIKTPTTYRGIMSTTQITNLWSYSKQFIR